MKLLINDANILIDIVKLGLVEAFLSLDFDLHTTDFVFAELDDQQQKDISSERLKIITTVNQQDFTSIMSLLNAHKGLSFEDCSVWHYTQKLEGTLITGDGALRKKALQSGLNVKGIIYIIEEIKNNGLLPLQTCIEKLTELKVINNRLPLQEIDKRIEIWMMER
ncbi:MAG: PIN domain-containing protein [Paludibacter sp.]|nr:PIN domain-containing protein [Paludibacter sp.]